MNAQELEIQRIRLEKELTIGKVPFEPEPSNPNACHLQIKLGERTMKRRFLMTDTVKVIMSIKHELKIFAQVFLSTHEITVIIAALFTVYYTLKIELHFFSSFSGRLSLDIQPTRFSSEFRDNNELSQKSPLPL